MERLTIKEIIEHCKRQTEMYEKGVSADYFDVTPMTNSVKKYWEHKQVAEYLEEMMKYRELEEQGKLLKLPCKVGDTVYRVNAGAKQPIIPMTVSEIHFLCYKNERAVRFDAIGKKDMGESCYRLEDIGRIVFLTHEEAEKKLEEMKGEHDAGRNHY